MGKQDLSKSKDIHDVPTVKVFSNEQMLELEDHISKKMEPVEEMAKIIEHESWKEGSKEFVL